MKIIIYTKYTIFTRVIIDTQNLHETPFDTRNTYSNYKFQNMTIHNKQKFQNFITLDQCVHVPAARTEWVCEGARAEPEGSGQMQTRVTGDRLAALALASPDVQRVGPSAEAQVEADAFESGPKEEDKEFSLGWRGDASPAAAARRGRAAAPHAASLLYVPTVDSG